MNYRTTRHSLTFTRPFTISGIDVVQPPGIYLVEMDEETIEGISFLAYRRVATRLRLAKDPFHPGLTEFVEVNCAEITAALDASGELNDEPQRQPKATPNPHNTGSWRETAPRQPQGKRIGRAQRAARAMMTMVRIPGTTVRAALVRR